MNASKLAVIGALGLLTCMCAPPSDPSVTESLADFERSADGQHVRQTKQSDVAYQLTHLAVFTYVWGPASRDRAQRDVDKTVRFWFGRGVRGRSDSSIKAKTVDLGESEGDRGRLAEMTLSQKTSHLRYGQAKNLPLRALEPKLVFRYTENVAHQRSFERSIPTSALDCDGELHKLDFVAPSVLASPKAGELRRGIVAEYVCSRIDAVQHGFAACGRADLDCDGANTLADPSEDSGHATQTMQTEPVYQLTHLAVFTYVWGPAVEDTAPRDADKVIRFWFGRGAKKGPSHGSIEAKTADLGHFDTDWQRTAEITAQQEMHHLKHGQAKDLPVRGLEPKLGFAYYGIGHLERIPATGVECDGNLHKLDLVAKAVLESPLPGELRRGLIVTYACSRADAVQDGFAACARADQDCDGAITLADLDDFEVDLGVTDGFTNIFDSCAGFRNDLGFSPDWGSWGRR